MPGVAGKTVLVTGAARGIGAETAHRLVAAGANVALVGLEPDLLERRAGELGDRAAAFAADVTDNGALDAAVTGTVERFGGIDVVVANAGVSPNGAVATMDREAFERTIEINLLGVWRTVRACLPHVVERRGYVLPISSLAAAVHLPLMAPYAASKAAVEAFADVLRLEVRHTGTRVGCAYFSFIDTDMVRRGFAHRSSEVMRSGAGPFARTIPVGRAAAAVVRGIERRSRHVVAPRWVLPLLYVRTIAQPIAERGALRGDVAEAVRVAGDEPTELTTPQA